MKYTIKWIEENLGISRKTINDYMNPKRYGYIEDKRYLNKLMEFTEAEVKKIWYIKTFIGMGYNHKNVKDMIKNNECDFSSTISNKIDQLNEEIKLKVQALEFAKTIKLTGRVPIIKEIGTMKYEEFMKYIKENYNFARDYNYEMIEMSLKKECVDDCTLEDIDKMYSKLESIGLDKLYVSATIDTYFRIISKLKSYGNKSDIIQSIVRLLFEYFKDNLFKKNNEFDEQVFSTDLWPRFLEGDVGRMYQKIYGKDNIDFIDKAIIYFGVLNKGE